MLLKAKALLQVVLIITAAFTVSLINTNQVKAAEQVCCEKTKQGETCQDTTADQCDPAFTQASSSCSETQFCGNVCCYQANTGLCNNAVPLSTCIAKGGNPYQGNCDAVQACELGCCQIGNNYMLATEQQCKQISSQYPQLAGQDNFDEALQDELQCVQRAYGGVEGCCVDFGTCSYTSQELCPTTGQQQNGNDGFYPNVLCSSPSLDCECTPRARKGCYQDDVYWYDSCGNKEEIAETCEANTICKADGDNAQCASLDCQSTQSYKNNPHDPKVESGGARKNGKSWCVYESPTGNFKDYPGSRHYRHYCYEGEEYVEPCRDFREEICVQGILTKTDGSTESSATCLENVHKKEGYGKKTNITTVPLGQAFWKRSSSNEERESPNQDSKKICKKGEVECTIYYIKEDYFSGWECVANCECESQEWTDEAATYCMAQGDCGMTYNVLQKQSKRGFKVVGDGIDGPPKTPSISYWKELKKYGVFGGMARMAQGYGALLKQYYERNLNYDDSFDKPGGRGDPLGYFGHSSVRGIIETLILIFAGPALIVFRFIFGSLVEKLLDLIFGTDTDKVTVRTLCKPYVPPKGGKDCGKCDDDPLHPCTEYKCKSFGASCKLINEGSEKAACIDDNPNDVTAPLISPWQEGISSGYIAAPTPKGYLIQPTVPAYTPVTLGIETDEPSQCSYDNARKKDIDEMQNQVDEYYGSYHNFTVYPVPGASTSYYVRCEDTHGNSNIAEYEIIVTTAPMPDLTPPLVTSTSIKNGGYVPYTSGSTFIRVTTNEPAHCSWGKNDAEYSAMQFTFICNNNTFQEQASCDTTLTNLTADKNTFYFRCRDNQGNVNSQSYEYALQRSSSPLNITILSPAQEIFTQNTTITLKTSGGAPVPVTCSYSTTNASFIDFYITGSQRHEQQLSNLNLGSYTYYIFCSDTIGNTASTTLQFSVNVDLSGPRILYMYKDSAAVHILFDEPAACAYHNSQFAEGSIAYSSLMKDHTFQINGREMYVQCADKDNNLGEMMKIRL